MANSDFLVVGIGASAGGIQATKQFFEHVPASTGLAYVVVLHLSPDHESHLAEVLQVSTVLPVSQVRDRVRVEPDHVYVIPPQQSLAIQDGYLSLSEITRFEERRAPVDIFFRTLAESHGPSAVAVVLSGTGANGSMGMKRIKELGGICFVQEPEEAEYGDMPRNSIATGLVDHVLPVARIPASILDYKANLGRLRLSESLAEQRPSDETAVRDVLSQLRSRTTHDFSNYKRPTVLRRIARRMGLHQVADLPAYARFLREHPEEVQPLLRDILISVTNFFRDGEAFDALERLVIPKLFVGKTENDHVRVWVPGCATGEEAYSIAMLLAEFAAATNAPPAIQIFATDIDPVAIATARDGVYTPNDAADVTPERLRRFFSKEGEHYRVRPELREMVLFADHNLIKDPPFSHLDLVACRNLLIYLNRSAQQRVMEVIHFALNPEGYLFLGSSESIEGSSDLFVTVDKDAHVFQSREMSTRVPPPMPDLFVADRLEPRDRKNAGERRARERVSSGELHHRLLEAYAPPSIVVNEEHDIVHLSERAGRYLQYAGGEPSHNLLKSIRPELRFELRTALYQAAQQRTDVVVSNLVLSIGERAVSLDLIIRPVLRHDDPARGFFLVVFNETGEATAATVVAATPFSSGDAARQLEDELLRVKAQLRATVERHETQAEELKASNEELQAMNEELRSSAEELETSKEELQSLNEELRTVNQELKVNLEEQSEANDDIQNLINSTEIGTIFLDRASRIKLFTPRAREIFTLIAADRGRPLSDMSTTLLDVDLAADVERVLEHLERVEREVKTRDDRRHLMRILPYRTADDRIDGVVLTFVDITERTRAEEAMRASKERLARALAIETVGVISFTSDGRLTDANDAFLQMCGYSREDLGDGALRWDTLAPPEDRGQALRAMEELERLGRIKPYETQMYRKDGSRWWSKSAATRVAPGEGVAFVIDLTERKRAEQLRHWSEWRLRLILDSATDYAICTLDAEGRIDSWNPGAARIFGYAEDEVLGKPATMLFTESDRESGAADGEIQRARRDGRASDERWHVRKDGTRFFASGDLVALRTEDNSLIGFVKIARDLTEKKRWEDALRHAHDELEMRVQQRTAELATVNRALDAELKERRQAEAQIRGLMRRLLTIQEDERRRIARDLHDQVGQQVAALGLKMDALNAILHDPDQMRRAIEAARETIARLDRDLDFFTWELRPAALDDLGLVVTLGNFTREWSKEFGIPADFQSRGMEQFRLSYEIETNLYRVAQEALNNVYKHASARRAGVILERRGPQVVLVIEDDGVGFDRQETAAPGIARGMGLLGMQERAAFIGGSLEIETAPGHGTTVFVQVPLHIAEAVERER